MVLSENVSSQIVTSAKRFIDRAYDGRNFNCVHFVREVYAEVGIVLPMINPHGYPPNNFHLSEIEFAMMPMGHCVFFKKIISRLPRIWTHVAIVASSDSLIHCSWRAGKVVITSQTEFLDVYKLSPKLL